MTFQFGGKLVDILFGRKEIQYDDRRGFLTYFNLRRGGGGRFVKKKLQFVNFWNSL